MPRFCSSCGRPVGSDDRFCGDCGDPVGSGLPGRGRRRVAALATIVAILGVVVMAWLGGGGAVEHPPAALESDETLDALPPPNTTAPPKEVESEPVTSIGVPASSGIVTVTVRRIGCELPEFDIQFTGTALRHLRESGAPHGHFCIMLLEIGNTSTDQVLPIRMGTPPTDYPQLRLGVGENRYLYHHGRVSPFRRYVEVLENGGHPIPRPSPHIELTDHLDDKWPPKQRSLGPGDVWDGMAVFEMPVGSLPTFIEFRETPDSEILRIRIDGSSLERFPHPLEFPGCHSDQRTGRTTCPVR